MLIAIRQNSLVFSYHIRPDLINVGRMSKVNHIGCIAACRSHIDLKPNEVANFTESGFSFCEAEELQVYKSAFYSERFYGNSADTYLQF